MTDKLELKSCHEVIYTVDVANIESIFHGKPIDPDILTVVMKDGKRLYCDEICPIDSLQEEPVSEFMNIESMIKSYKQRLISQANGVKNSPLIDMCLASYEHGINETLDTLKLSNVQRTLKNRKEPVSGLDNGDMPIERWKQAVKAASNQRNYRSSKGLTENRDDYFVDGVQWADEHPKEEPVSEDLEEEIHRYYVDWDEHPQYVQTARHFANWQKENLWKNAQGDDLPEIDREVIVLYQPYPCEGNEYVVSFAHRPNPNGWDGKNVITGKVEHYTPKTYDKGGWSIPNVVWWLDLDLPIKGE